MSSCLRTQADGCLRLGHAILTGRAEPDHAGAHTLLLLDKMKVLPAYVPWPKASHMAKSKTSGVGVILCLERGNDPLSTNNAINL